MKQNVIAIDGPAGAGKSTVAKKVADELEFIYIDTGAMYRAVTCQVLDRSIESTDVDRISAVAKQIVVRFTREAGVTCVWAGENNVTDRIRTPEVTAAVAKISQVPAVRQAMMRMQREMASLGSVVLDGRDIGTVVVPDACTKIFMTASVEERARRRWFEMRLTDYDTDLSEIRRKMEQRDREDIEREIAPLTQAPDAVLVDTTGLSIDAVVKKIIQIYHSRCNHV